MTPAIPVFVTARFRTGSTMLWNLFRQIPGVTSYYEPDHDNLVAHIEADTPVQESHRGVTSYWDEYRPFAGELASAHRNEFGVWRLLLERSDSDPEFERYLRLLVDRSRPNRAVLQCNRMDFRLPWLKARFPDARIVHLFRNPRDQWQSITRGLDDERAVDPDSNTHYDLVVWGMSLSHVFPFLVGPHIRHSYERHYLIWRLSRLMGSRCADVSLSYDDDFCASPEHGVARLLDAAGVSTADVTALAEIVDVPPRAGRAASPLLAGADRMEAACDALLDRLGLTERFGCAPLADIRRDHASVWAPFEAAAGAEAARLGSRTFSRMRSHYIDIVHRMRVLGVNAHNVELALQRTEQELQKWKTPLGS